MERYAEADAAYNKALALVPEDLESQTGRVTAFQMRGDLDGAGKTLAAIPPGVDPGVRFQWRDFSLRSLGAKLPIFRWAVASAPQIVFAVFERAPDFFP